MGISSNLTDCFNLCTKRDLKASHYFQEEKNPTIKKIDSKEKDEVNSNSKNDNEDNNTSNNSSNLDCEYLAQSELEEINEKICNKYQKYEQMPQRPTNLNIIYRSGILNSGIRNDNF